ncbi:MAG: 2-oxoacid:acceptor oxidoreductase subunit alpha, partial [Candidatus Ranarchaeia archaeon]
CKFYAAYPMTPSSGVLHFLAKNKREYDMIVLHPESEIATINMVAGASFAGARSMTSTSGGGFCLMSEGLGLIGMSEIPVVIHVAQRPGPSTGLPTYTGQGDLRFVIHASQGEFPRLVIAPGDIEECFYDVVAAFNWADKYQVPVIILTDKHLVESQSTVTPFDPKKISIERGEIIHGRYRDKDVYKRYVITETGVSPRAIPGTKGLLVRSNGDEHDETGFTSDQAENSRHMMDKRLRKLRYLSDELSNVDTTKWYGAEEAEATVISWGSTKGAVREAMRILSMDGVQINYLQVRYLVPFPSDRIGDALSRVKISILVENNATGQLSSLIREHLLRDVDHKILKYDGRPFTPDELAKNIVEAL